MTAKPLDNRCLICSVEHPPMDCPFEPHGVGDPRQGAGYLEISFPYGSVFDTTYLIGVICDKCALVFVNDLAARMTGYGALFNPKRWLDVIDGQPKEEKELDEHEEEARKKYLAGIANDFCRE